MGGESDMEVRDLQDVPGDVVDPVIDMDFAARWAEAGFA